MVGRVGGRAVRRRLGPGGQHHGARRVALDDPEQEVGGAQQGVDGAVVGAADRPGQREEGAVQERGGVDGEERGGHRAAHRTAARPTARAARPRLAPARPAAPGTVGGRHRPEERPWTSTSWCSASARSWPSRASPRRCWRRGSSSRAGTPAPMFAGGAVGEGLGGSLSGLAGSVGVVAGGAIAGGHANDAALGPAGADGRRRHAPRGARLRLGARPRPPPTGLLFRIPRDRLTSRVHQRVNVRVLELVDDATGASVELEGSRDPHPPHRRRRSRRCAADRAPPVGRRAPLAVPSGPCRASPPHASGAPRSSAASSPGRARAGSGTARRTPCAPTSGPTRPAASGRCAPPTSSSSSSGR